MGDFGLMVLVCALVVGWLVVTICSFFRQQQNVEASATVEESVGWNSPRLQPPERGRFCSRVPGKPYTESMSTYWNGVRWIYLDGFECYIQEREWRELPAAMPEGAS